MKRQPHTHAELPHREPTFSRRHIIIAVSVLAVILIGIGIEQAGQDTAAPPAHSPTAIFAGQAIGNSYTTKSWVLHYDRVQASADSTFIQADGIHNAIFFRHGKPGAHVDADHIDANLATKDLAIRGHIKIRTTLGGAERTFATDAATWTQTQGLLAMPGRLVITSKGATLTVDHGSVNMLSGQIQLGRIDGNIRP